MMSFVQSRSKEQKIIVLAINIIRLTFLLKEKSLIMKKILYSIFDLNKRQVFFSQCKQ